MSQILYVHGWAYKINTHNVLREIIREVENMNKEQESPKRTSRFEREPGHISRN